MYIPNTKDPRVVSRIKLALGFSKGVLSETKPHQWSTRYIDRYLGQAQTDLGKWLRQHLLITHSNRYNKDTGECKSYTLNVQGYDYIKSYLKGDTKQSLSEWTMPSESSARTNMSLRELVESNGDIDYDEEVRLSGSSINTTHSTPSVYDLQDHNLIAQWAYTEFREELATGDFKYDDKSHRLWHPIQNIKREHKQPMLAGAGYRHHYDIECAAPTLIHQHAQRQQDPMDLYLFALRRYLNNKTEVRNELSKELNIPIENTKKLINALFCGAKIGHVEDFATTALLLNDSNRINKAKQNTYLIELREDIKTCWEYIKPSMSRTSITDKNKKQRMLPISPRQKWNRYFDLERTVLNEVKRYLSERTIACFTEHDGWCTISEINQRELIDYISERTGYEIKLQYKEIIEGSSKNTTHSTPSVYDLQDQLYYKSNELS